MSANTRQLPCTPVVDGIPTFHEFSGVDVGPLFVHRSFPDNQAQHPRSGWTVTHTPTGYSIAKGVPTKARALVTARRLSRLKCWDFSTADQASSIDPDVLLIIRDIRAAA